MLAVRSIDVRNNFKAICERVFSGETVIVSRKENRNVVMLSENEYNELLKAKRNEDYLSMLDTSFAELAHGNIISKSQQELEETE